MFWKNKRTTQLEEKIKKLEQEKEELLLKRSLFEFFDDPIPKNQDDRKKYMSDVAFAYTIMRDKLRHFIQLEKNALAEVGYPAEQYRIYRSNIYCFTVFDQWMERCTNEHLGDLQEARNRLEVYD